MSRIADLIFAMALICAGFLLCYRIFGYTERIAAEELWFFIKAMV